MAEDRRFQVFVSSTSDDLREQRQKIWESLVSLDYIVSGMEAFPATSDAQFAYIKQQIAQSDYYVLIIAGRYGTILENGLSYTEREFDYAQELGLPTLVFLHKDIASLAISKTDQDQQKMESLKAFREKASRNRLCSYWSTPDELALNVVKALQSAIKANPRPGWQRGNNTDTSELLTELRKLRLENDTLKAESSSKLSERASPELDQGLRKATSYLYSTKGAPAKYDTVQLAPRAILAEISIFEPTTFDIFEECLRGAIAAKTDQNFDNLTVDRAETDRVILLLAKMNIVKINRAGRSLQIDHGDNWLAAHSDVKLNR
jgi:hypothetical protein